MTRPEKGDPNHGQHCAQPGTLPVTDAPPQPPLSVTHKEIMADYTPPPQLPPDAPPIDKLKRDDQILAMAGYIPPSQIAAPDSVKITRPDR